MGNIILRRDRQLLRSLYEFIRVHIADLIQDIAVPSDTHVTDDHIWLSYCLKINWHFILRLLIVNLADTIWLRGD